MTINRCIITGVASPPTIGAGNVTQSTVSVSNSSTTVLAAGTRKYLIIQNRGSTAVYLNVAGATATTAGGIEIVPGGSYEPLVVPQGVITGIRSSATENVIVVSG